MNYRIIKRSDYPFLLTIDQKVYPTETPVAPKTLDEWYKNDPDFGIIFEEGGKITGVLMVIPLSEKGWNGLISGELTEADIRGDYVFDKTKDGSIGLHCYHIEKFTDGNDFYVEAYTILGHIIKRVCPATKVLGLSGFAVTTAGISLAFNKLNLREREFISNEHIVSKDGILEVIENLTQEKLEQLLANGYIYHNRCKLLITYPNEVSLVWKYMGYKK